MGIRDALAAEGNAPLIFMGGTCTGPKWRERLIAQVGQPFRWFNPVVAEWTQEAKESEIAVRAESDVLLYCITPYQEGCYSYLEMTEDAVRSDKTVVVCFLPSFEDKAFNEAQWSSIMSAQTLLLKHKVHVFLSMEQTIDWFNHYTPTAADSKLLDAATLIERAKEHPEGQTDKKAPSTADGIQNGLVEVRAEEFSKPTPAEPGTTPAQPEGSPTVNEADDEGLPKAAQLVENVREGKSEGTSSNESLTVSQEGIGDWIKRLFGVSVDKKETLIKPQTNERTAKRKTWLDSIPRDLEKTLGNEKWLAEHWNAEAVKILDWRCLIVGNSVNSNGQTALGRILGEAKSYTRTATTTLERYYKDVTLAAREIQEGHDSGKIKDEELSGLILKGIATVKAPVRNKQKVTSWAGGSTAEFVHSSTGVGGGAVLAVMPAKDNVVGEVTPALVASYVRGVLDIAHAYYDILNEWRSNDALMYIGIGMSNGFWTSDAIGKDVWDKVGQHYSRGTAEIVTAFYQFPLNETGRALANIINNAHVVTGSVASVEALVD